MRQPGLVVVISSPSGAGKTTVCRRLVHKFKDYQFSISATTRKPRREEKDGVDYIFVTEDKFLKLRRAGFFIETAKYLGSWYGTPRAPLEKAVQRGKVMLLAIDVRGGKSIKRALKDAVLIFLAPPNLSELKKRLRNRHTEAPLSQEKRLNVAVKELKSMRSYDYVVINDVLKSAVEKIHWIIEAERHKVERLTGKKIWENFGEIFRFVRKPPIVSKG